MIPSLIGLHSILNDDDSDIRTLGSKAISIILKEQMVPQAANADFAKHLLEHYSDSPLFVKYVVSKITGTPTENLDKGSKNALALTSVLSQYDEASVNDNKLFVEEKQNLWLDDVEEAKVWAATFAKLPGTMFGVDCPAQPLHPVLAELIIWVKGAVIILRKSSSSSDNALGWTSKPDVFSVLMRAITAINAVLDFLEQHFLPAIDRHPGKWTSTGLTMQTDFDEIISGLSKFVGQSLSNRLHPVLLETACMRNSRREEVTRQFQIYHHLVQPVGELRGLKFPLGS